MRQIGHAILSLSLPSGETEKYLITLPKLVIQGLLVGSPYIELSETSWIVSSTGWVSTVCSFLLKRRVSFTHSYCHFDTKDRVLWTRLFQRESAYIQSYRHTSIHLRYDPTLHIRRTMGLHLAGQENRNEVHERDESQRRSDRRAGRCAEGSV